MNTNTALLTKEQIQHLHSKYSTTTTYCKHSGVKLIIGTEFQNSFLKGKLIQHSHFIFTLTTHELLRLAKSHLYDGNPTEQSLITNAILHKLGVVTTTSKHNCSPLFIDEKSVIKLHKATNALIKVWAHYESSAVEMPKLPTLVVNKDNCSDYTTLANAIKLCLERLDEHSFRTQLTTRSTERTLERDYDNELNKEKAFQAVLDTYSAKTQPKKYTKKLGTWAAKQLAIHCPDIKAEVLASINHYIQSDSNKLDNEILQKYIKLLEEVLPMDSDSYETSHLVIRHLKSKLESINKELADYGFIILELEEELVGKSNKTEGTATGIRYSTKTKTTVVGNMPKKVAKANRTSTNNIGTKLGGAGSPLARMMAKFANKSTTSEEL